ncbi:MAG TPA: hypothetical protein VKP88_05690, partial [Candidatus Paceibacterota bacterium]|nr:hypothetical protein [Candidatus Paceibacterota bacterium]
MDKKWNLQDIKPAQRNERPSRPAAQPRPAEMPRRPESTPRADTDAADTLTVPVESGAKKRR